MQRPLMGQDIKIEDIRDVRRKVTMALYLSTLVHFSNTSNITLAFSLIRFPLNIVEMRKNWHYKF